MTTETATLLPKAKIGVFARDKGLKDMMGQLEDDWRFARIDLDSVGQDVTDAIENGHRLDAYNLIVIETETVDESFVAQLESLAEFVSEGTAAVVVGPTNDVDLYRRLIEMGVSDYLVLPVSSDKMANVISKALFEQLGAGGSTLIACIGAKGGVGTSALAHLLALATGEILQEKTIILDAAGGRSFLSVSMGSEPVSTLVAAAKASTASDKDNLKRMILTAREKTSFLATGSEAILDDGLGATDFENILNAAMSEYPVTIVDLSGARSSVARRVLERAHKVILVTLPTVQSLRACLTLQQEYASIKTDEKKSGLSTCVNMAGMFGKAEVPSQDIEKALNDKPSMIIPFEPKCFPKVEMDGAFSLDNEYCSVIAHKLLDMMSDILKGTGKHKAPQTKEKGFVENILSKITK